MKLKNIIVKAFSFVVSIGILAVCIPAQLAIAAPNTEKVIYEDSTYKVTETTNKRTVLNKESLQSITLTFTNDKHNK